MFVDWAGATIPVYDRNTGIPVQVTERWIVAALRHRKFFSLDELNEVIRELLDRLNHRPFRKKDGTRASVWEAVDRPALKPLPLEPFDSERVVARPR